MRRRKSLKTTLISFSLAVLLVVDALLRSGKTDWKLLTVAALVAALGFCAKDYNVR